MQGSSRFLSRAAALAILAALPALPIYFGLLPMVQSYRDLSLDLNQKRALLARFSSELAGREQLEQELEAALQRQQADTIYLKGTSEAAAAARWPRPTAPSCAACNPSPRSRKTACNA